MLSAHMVVQTFLTSPGVFVNESIARPTCERSALARVRGNMRFEQDRLLLQRGATVARMKDLPNCQPNSQTLTPNEVTIRPDYFTAIVEFGRFMSW